LWAVVNERDELGNDLVPDYLTSVKEGAFYGWPWSYYGAHVDTRVEPARPDMVAKAIPPDFALGPHVASLGLAFARAGAWPTPFREGAFIGLHGSWNRDPPSGYKVVFVPFAAASRRAMRWMCSRASSMPKAMRTVARWASHSPRAAPCSLPTMSATSSGGSRRLRSDQRSATCGVASKRRA
jgi:hypothetical protein